MPSVNIPAIWSQIAQHVVAGLEVQPGQLILVQDRAGRQDVLLAMLMAIELAGATPLPELVANSYLNELLRNASPAYLENWERHRREWMEQVDAILNLAGLPLDLTGVPDATARAFLAATQRVGEVEEARGVPNLVLATPDQAHAAALGLDLAKLERRLLPALAADPMVLRREIDQVLTAVANIHTITIHSGDGCTLHLRLADGRPWLIDDGVIDAGDHAAGAVVSNLPAGSIYTTGGENESSLNIDFAIPQATLLADDRVIIKNGRMVL